MANHPVGIVLRHVGYSTIPTMEELSVIGLDDNGECIVPSFTVVREGYGKCCTHLPGVFANIREDPRFMTLDCLGPIRGTCGKGITSAGVIC